MEPKDRRAVNLPGGRRRGGYFGLVGILTLLSWITFSPAG